MTHRSTPPSKHPSKGLTKDSKPPASARPSRLTVPVQSDWLEAIEGPTVHHPKDRKRPPRLPGSGLTVPPMPVHGAPPQIDTMEVDMGWVELVDTQKPLGPTFSKRPSKAPSLTPQKATSVRADANLTAVSVAQKAVRLEHHIAAIRALLPGLFAPTTDPHEMATLLSIAASVSSLAADVSDSVATLAIKKKRKTTTRKRKTQ